MNYRINKQPGESSTCERADVLWDNWVGLHLVSFSGEKKKSFGQSSRNYLTNDDGVQSCHCPWIFLHALRNDKKCFLQHDDDDGGGAGT